MEPINNVIRAIEEMTADLNKPAGTPAKPVVVTRADLLKGDAEIIRKIKSGEAVVESEDRPAGGYWTPRK